MNKTVKTERGSYGITVERGALARAHELFDLDRRVLILSDDGVPAAYVQALAAQCTTPTVLILPQGEASKSFSSFEKVLLTMLEAGFTRTDALLAVGGGVCGDLGGFAASAFMRGIDFYNVPTTLLSQVDSSVGGKTAIDLGGIKNCVGAFYPPKGVLIDPDVLLTLPARQMACGMAEVIKMAATSDGALFSDLERGLSDMTEIISRALDIKIAVVEADEHEGGLRRVLNFGHTVGHGIEAATELLHGECVALGMLPMCADGVRERLLSLYTRYGLPTAMQGDGARVAEAILHDKKLAGKMLCTVFVPAVGEFEFRREAALDFAARVKEYF
jgi:3-dehydroquinate synthase